jgi:hypothetical protein
MLSMFVLSVGVECTKGVQPACLNRSTSREQTHKSVSVLHRVGSFFFFNPGAEGLTENPQPRNCVLEKD